MDFQTVSESARMSAVIPESFASSKFNALTL
jgi:hypothetical protein